MLETSAFQIFHGGNSTFISLFDKTKFSKLGLTWLHILSVTYTQRKNFKTF